MIIIILSVVYFFIFIDLILTKDNHLCGAPLDDLSRAFERGVRQASEACGREE